MSEPETPEVRPNQVWQDNDPRSQGRRVKIVEVVRAPERPYAVVRPVDNPSGRQTRIKLSRFRDNASGYRLMQDPPQS